MYSGFEGVVCFLLECSVLGLLQHMHHNFTSLGRMEEESEFIRALILVLFCLCLFVHVGKTEGIDLNPVKSILPILPR